MSIKNTNICFVANFFKTYLFHELAKSLAKHGFGINWIVTKKDQYDYLKEFYPSENILYINRSNAFLNNSAVGDFKLNELVYGDRVFKHDIVTGLKFLTNIQRPIYDFISNNRIKFIFGEFTWAHELLIHRMVRNRLELGCKYIDCCLVRIPNFRVGFFADESYSQLLEFEKNESINKIIQLEKPSYLLLNDKIVAKSTSFGGRLARIKRFISGENIERNDPNVITDARVRFRVMSQEEYNKFTYKRVNTISFDEIENENYIFVGFHKQPESSIDVSGRYVEDQFLNIVNLWRILPQGWKIVVKEHTNAIGDRSLKFYKQLLSYPGIVMVNERTDSRRIIEKSKLVVTVSGTIAYEAALLKIPAITFSRVFFNRINYCRFMTFPELVEYQSLISLIEEINSQPDNRLEFSEYLMKNTFAAYISDSNTDPSVMAAENIKKLSEAFLLTIEKHADFNSNVSQR